MDKRVLPCNTIGEAIELYQEAGYNAFEQGDSSSVHMRKGDYLDIASHVTIWREGNNICAEDY